MITLLYRAATVAPVVRNIARTIGDGAQAVRDTTIRGALAPGLLVRYGSTQDLPWEGFEINSASAVRVAKDKRLSRALLGEAPATWFTEHNITYPAVVRPKEHFGGQNLVVCEDETQLRWTVLTAPFQRGWYASPLVNKTAEYRVWVLQGYVISVTQKFPGAESDIAWNLHAGGSSKVLSSPRDWPRPVVRAAVDAAATIKLDFSAVDVIVGDQNEVLVLEVNTSPGIHPGYTMRRLSTAFKWVALNGAPPIRGPEEKKWLHPALRKQEAE